MKIAITGKGGVGKSTIAAALAFRFKQLEKKVLAIDADPDSNLASALGIIEEIQKSITTIAHHQGLIEERTGAKIKEFGQIFKLNPEVDDIADTYAYEHKGISLLILGAVQSGGSGCACPENTLLRSLISSIILKKNEYVILDMEAGVEHLGRATATGIDIMIIVVEPGYRSIESAKRIASMAKDIGIQSLGIIINKVHSKDDIAYIKNNIPDYKILGTIEYSSHLLKSDRNGMSVSETDDPLFIQSINTIAEELENNLP